MAWKRLALVALAMGAATGCNRQMQFLSDSKVSVGTTPGRAMEFKIDADTYLHYRLYLDHGSTWRKYDVIVGVSR